MGLQRTVQRRAAIRYALARPHPEERACSNGSAKSNGRARVSKDEDGHGEGPHASRRIAAQPVCRNACAPSRCDAPQHEDAADFGQTKPTWRKDQPAAAGNDRRPRSFVSGLLFTMDGATPTCWAVSRRSAKDSVRAGGEGSASRVGVNGDRPPISQLLFSQRDAGSGWRPQQIDPCIYKPPRLRL
jgi:hypothetical protein